MMSDIVDRLRSVTDLQRETERSSYEQDDQLALEAADTITRLTAEIEQNRTDLEEYRLDVERLRAALLRWLDAVNDKYAFKYHQPDNLGKEWERVREAVNLAEDNASAVLLGSKP